MVKKIQDEQLVKIKRQDATDKKMSGPVSGNTSMLNKINQLLNFNNKDTKI